MIRLNNITKRFGEKEIYKDFSLDIEKGKILVILGESGAGKTTLLSIIASLTDFDGEVIGVDKPLSMVFQKDRLIPNLTVEENLRLVAPNANVDSVLEEFGILDSKNSYPKSLSGGMARRVSIARAMVYPAKTVLLDEPFINLNLALKFSLIDVIKQKQKNNGETIIMVTHDIKEAVSIADRIIVVDKNKIIYDNSQINEKVENELFDLFIKKKN